MVLEQEGSIDRSTQGHDTNAEPEAQVQEMGDKGTFVTSTPDGERVVLNIHPDDEGETD